MCLSSYRWWSWDLPRLIVCKDFKAQWQLNIGHGPQSLLILALGLCSVTPWPVFWAQRLNFIIYNFFLKFIYLKGKKGRREWFPWIGSLPKWLHRWSWANLKPADRKSGCVSHIGGRNLDTCWLLGASAGSCIVSEELIIWTSTLMGDVGLPRVPISSDFGKSMVFGGPLCLQSGNAEQKQSKAPMVLVGSWMWVT